MAIYIYLLYWNARLNRKIHFSSFFNLIALYFFKINVSFKIKLGNFLFVVILSPRLALSSFSFFSIFSK
uniref:Uncharacterized protein n=1 Tax=Meloidogyne enterolobii TaxID=390850 RepID=A0A6V7WTN6_MELEN|nr:unnamed protein product [Meloidogyne enterolobii]